MWHVWIPVVITSIAGGVALFLAWNLSTAPGVFAKVGVVAFSLLAVMAVVQAVGIALTDRGLMDLSQWPPWRWL